MTVNGIEKLSDTKYTYDAALESIVTGVTPHRGGTGGGTKITITGSGFGWVLKMSRKGRIKTLSYTDRSKKR